ncbi:MAG: RNA polymerase factor sigma-54, partial [Desulfobacteraceae bacterium]|nr:RNA polymerase factor sigma-54 [Desulfobacteraceae bacterium]
NYLFGPGFLLFEKFFAVKNMKLEMTGQMRLDQRMKLAPRMIQSMEILQLPILALQERIEHELNSNPVLEIDESAPPEETHSSEPQSSDDSAGKDGAAAKAEDFGRIENLGEDYRDYLTQIDPPYHRAYTGDTDRKLEAIKNTAAPSQSLNDYLNDQWRLLDLSEAVKKAGSAIIDYIDDRGYLTVRPEQLYSKDRCDFTLEDMQKALELVQELDPAGVGARNLAECLLIQMKQSPKDMSFEAKLVSEHMDALLENRLPEIARKMNCDIYTVNLAIKRMSKFDTSPGLQIGPDRSMPVTADVIVDFVEESGTYSVRLADNTLPALRVSDYYTKISRDAASDAKTKKFLKDNIRSARWIIEAIEQRKNTLLRVAEAVVKYQKDFFDKGQLYLKPLPMSKIADKVGVHLATVSRAVAGKYMQCGWGIIPLRKFFSGGTEDVDGHSRSWHAIRAKLREIIDSEDKSRPLSDDQIRKKLVQAGINNLARRTVAKYRKLLDIPTARLRKKY